jgi:outer membrane receptor protein involved in Fe transport
MKLIRIVGCLLPLIFLTAIAHAQSAGGIGGSQSQSSGQGGVQPPPPTTATPAEAQAKGIPPATAPNPPAPVSTSPAATPSASTAPAPAPGTTGQMQTIVVTASAEGSVLPNDQSVSSVYGGDISVQDTPRSVTVVNSQLLQDANITSLSDFVKVAPSAYTTDQYGVANVPVIRGQTAEVYINGMQRTTRTDGPPTSFNSVEQADVVAGPASSIYGPTANVGGYVNLVTKQPYFDRFHDDTEFTYGMYDEKLWTEDFGAPIIKDELAYRISYQGDYSGSYYNNELTNSNDGFVALAWTPTKDFRLDFNSEFYVARFSENIGWNRPTQGLIDNNQYSTGITTTGAFGGGPYPGGTYRGLINSPGTEYLSPQTTLVSPDDSNYGKDLNGELTLTYNINSDMTIIDRTYYEYLESRDYAISELYVNQLNNNTVQNRLEFHWDFDTPIGGSGSDPASDKKDAKDMKQMSEIDPPLVFKNEIIAGFAFKWVNALGYSDYFNEYLNATDLTTGTYPTVNNQSAPGYTKVYPVAGTNFSAAPGQNIGSTNQENAYVASAFFQHQITFTPQWMLLYSGRADLISDRVTNPIPGPEVSGIAYSTTQLLGTGDVSLDYKPMPWMTAYLTFDYNQSASGTEDGGYDTFANKLVPSDFHHENFLYEGGVKLDLLDHTLFSTVDGYYQTHSVTNAFGVTSEVRTLGAEISTTYQPDKHFYLTLNESYLDATLIDPGGQFTPNVYDAFTTSSVGVNGTGFGAPSFVAPPKGHYRESGLPQFLLAGTANYRFDNGLGFSLGYEITDPIPTTELANVWIPWQYELDSSVFYNYKNFSARVTFFNITNQENFSTGGYISSSGGDLVTVKEPFHVEGTIGYKF